MIVFSTINIKQATSEDISKVLPLFTQFFEEEGFDVACDDLSTAITAMLSDLGSAIFVAWHGVDAIGIATVTTTSRGLEFERYAELEDLYVVPEARNAGIGSALIEQVKRWCRKIGCTVLATVVTEDAQANRNLITYYEKHGFQPSKRSLLFYHLGVEPRANL